MNITKKIDELHKELFSIVKAEKRLAILIHELEDIEHDLAEIKITVDKEFEDVVKLEKTTTSFLYKGFLGDVNQKLNKERDEYLSAVLKYDDLANKIMLLQFEREVLETKISKKEQVYSDLEKNIIATKSNHEKHPLSEAILQFETKIKQKKQHLIDIDEAIIVGKELKILLTNLLKNLASFENNYNNQFQILYYDQVQQIKSFRHTISTIDQLEKNLNKELEDINYNVIQKNLYTPFISFFESIHSEMMIGWISSTHLRRAKNCIKDNVKNTDLILGFLKLEKQKNEYSIESLIKEKKLYLENC